MRRSDSPRPRSCRIAEEGFDSSDPHEVMRWIEKVYHQPADVGLVGDADAEPDRKNFQVKVSFPGLQL